MKITYRLSLYLLSLVIFATFTATVNGDQLPSVEELIASDGEVEVDSQARGFFEKAIASYKADDMASAIHYSTLAFRKDRRILLLADEGLIDAIVSYFKEKSRKSPKNPTLFYGLAKILAIRGKINEAKDALEKIVSIDPDSDLGRRAATVLKGAPGNVSSSQNSEGNATSASSYEEEYARLEAKNSKLQSKNTRLLREINEKQERVERQSSINARKDKQIAELAEQNRMDHLYSKLFWANPNNFRALKNNYTRPTPGQIEQYPDYYKAKAAQDKARADYYKSYAPTGSSDKPSQLPSGRR